VPVAARGVSGNEHHAGGGSGNGGGHGKCRAAQPCLAVLLGLVLAFVCRMLPLSPRMLRYPPGPAQPGIFPPVGRLSSVQAALSCCSPSKHPDVRANLHADTPGMLRETRIHYH